MRRMLAYFSTAVLALGGYPLISMSAADVFGSGENAFEIEFVTIGDPGNPPDTTGNPNPAGSVPYAYRIGKYEVSREMVEKSNAAGGLGITLADMTPYGGNGANKPATGVTWFEAARFVNWLNTSKGHMPAYKFVPLDRFSSPELVASRGFVLWEPGDPGFNPDNLFRNSQAHYFLPSADEWYKAAFYDPTTATYFQYPTGSNTPPISVVSGTVSGTAVFFLNISVGPANITQAGGLSPYGTMAQGGNVYEWEETNLDLVNDDPLEWRGRRGGNWEFSSLTSSARFASQPENAVFVTGFRVASVVPEPTSIVLSCFGSALFILSIQSRSSRRRTLRAHHTP